jgi:sulfur carrier protein ThiS
MGVVHDQQYLNLIHNSCNFMRIFLQKEQRSVEMEYAGTARALLQQLDVNPEVVLIVKDGALITLDEDVSDAKLVELLSVISGG